MGADEDSEVLVGWTTLSCKEEACKLIETLVNLDLVACAQLDGPVISSFKWEGEVKTENEWRVTLKFARKKEKAVTKKVLEEHPYEVPQWLFSTTKSFTQYSNWVNGDL